MECSSWAVAAARTRAGALHVDGTLGAWSACTNVRSHKRRKTLRRREKLLGGRGELEYAFLFEPAKARSVTSHLLQMLCDDGVALALPAARECRDWSRACLEGIYGGAPSRSCASEGCERLQWALVLKHVSSFCHRQNLRLPRHRLQPWLGPVVGATEALSPTIYDTM